MSIIEQATRRLEELRRGGVEVPWEAAGLTEPQFNELLKREPPDDKRTVPTASSPPASAEQASLPAAAMQRKLLLESAPQPAPPERRPAKVPRAPTVEIDLARLAREGYLAPALVRSELALEFRRIKRPLLANAADRNGGSRKALVMITSALPAEGKTYCAINLAMSMAMEVDTSVLLVDADVIRPSILDRFGLPPAKGFLDVLTDDALDLSEVILRTNVPKLSILPAGTRNVMSSELLGSSAMDRLLMELANRYSDRVVILDAPPLLLTTESRVLAASVGQVVIVVDSENTTVSKVTEAFAAVQDCPLVLSILNMSSQAERRYGDYGYDYR